MRNTVRTERPASCSPNNITALLNIAHILRIHPRAHVTFEASYIERACAIGFFSTHYAAIGNSTNSITCPDSRHGIIK